MSNLKPKNFIPIIGLFFLEKTTRLEELVLQIYHALVIFGISVFIYGKLYHII